MTSEKTNEPSNPLPPPPDPEVGSESKVTEMVEENPPIPLTSKVH